MIPESRPILFVWIPKTGGTSIYEWMKVNRGMKIFIDDYGRFDNTGSVTFGHAKPLELIRRKIISKDYWSRCFAFTVVRNPYSRFISLFNDFKRSKRIAPDTKLIEFAQAVRHSSRKPGLFNVMDFSQAGSVAEWIVPGINILRYENLDAELKGLFGDVKLARLNTGNSGEWKSYYDTESARLVTDIYYDTIALFNYDLLN